MQKLHCTRTLHSANRDNAKKQQTLTGLAKFYYQAKASNSDGLAKIGHSLASTPPPPHLQKLANSQRFLAFWPGEESAETKVENGKPLGVRTALGTNEGYDNVL